MKKVYFLLTTLLLCVCSLMAQAPERFSYQAVVRDASNHLITGASVSVRVSVLQGSVTGNTIYSETQSTVTNANGLMTLEIGGGTNQTGTFSAINWGYGPYFLKTEIDPAGGTNYSISSVQQLLSVPYALYSKEAGNGFSGDYNDLTNTPAIPAAQVNSDWNATTGVAEILNKPTIPSVPTNVSAFTNDAGYVTSAAIPTVPTNVSAFANDVPYLVTEQQVLSISNDTIYLSGGSFVKLPATTTGFSGNYSDLVGAPNLATVATSGSYNDLTNTPAIPAAQVNSDWNATSGVAQILNKPTIPAAQVNADWNATSGAAEILNKPTIPTVPTNVGDFENNVGYITMDQLTVLMNSMMSTVNARLDSMQQVIDSLQNLQPTGPSAAPSVSTSAVSGVTDVTATCGGNVTSNGGGVILERGLCWSTSANPTISGNHIAVAGDTGSFTGTLTDLMSGTTYHVRAFATNALGTSYGEDYTFTTAAQLSPLGFRLGNSCVLNNGNCQNYWMTGVVDANDNTEGLFVTNNGVNPGYNNTQTSTVMTEILFQMPMLDSIHVEFDLLCGGEGCCDYLKAFLCLPSVTFEPGDGNDYSSASYSGNNAFNFAAFLNQTGESYNPYKINLTQGNTVHIRLRVANPAPGGQAKLVFLWQNDNSVGNPPGAVITHLIVCDPADAPAVLTVSTSPVTEILDHSAVCGGEVFYDDDAAVTARGVCWSTSHNPTIADSHTVDGTGTGAFTSQLTGLQPITQYFVRAYATGNGQTVYGEEKMFWTLNLISVPTVSTASVSNITATSATCGVQVGYNGGAPVTACGVCWSTSPNPTIADNHTVDGTADGNYTSQLTGLSSYTTYYVRAYATNVAGTGYGSEKVFTTLAVIPAGDGQPCPGVATVTDYDNNVYNTVKIGTQCWLKENLRSTHYTNGVAIPGYLAPMEDQSYVAEYGYLYNWAAVMRNANSSTANPSGVQGICPDGWHVPSEAEWTQLTDYVASQPAYWCMSYNEPHTAKALANSTGWNSGSAFCAPGRDMVDNNITGFSAMPAGEWVSNHCRDKGKVVYYWSTSMGNDDKAMTLGLLNNNPDVSVGDFHVVNKYAVRCVLAAGASAATVTTAAVSNVTAFTATCGGTVVSDGGDPVTARGVCWSTTPTPTIADNHTVDGAGTGVFTSQITGLSPLTTYYVCAYATNAVGTAYGEVQTFTTTLNIELPVVLTQPVTNITETHAYGHGSVTSEGGAMVTERGVCWSVSPNPTLADNHAANTNGGLGSYNVLMDNLLPGTTYHVRAYAINSAGVGYGEDETFTTVALPVLATVQTLSMSDITSETAVCHGEVVSDNGFGVTLRGFRWGTTPDLENTYNGSVSVGSGVGIFSATLQNLNPNTTYYVMAYATNSAGTAYGEVISFTTNSPDPVLPSLITTPLTDVSATTAICGGIVSDDGGAVITTRGLCWSTTANPTSSDNHVTVEGGVGSFTAQMSGLEPYTTYHVRAYATNSAGTAYGNELTFTTKALKPAGDGQPCPGNLTVTDVDGNVYNTVMIGNQCWMKENLRTTHFADGKMLTGPYFAPNGDSTNVANYGYLYHWVDAMKGANGSAENTHGVQGICPNGWHLPSDAEWTQLTDYVSAQQAYLCTAYTQNTIAKSLASQVGWQAHTMDCRVGYNLDENNATGFSAMPAGDVNEYLPRYFGQTAYFWSATANESGYGWTRMMQHNSYSLNRSASHPYNNYSVRCVLGNGADLADVVTGGVSDLAAVTVVIGGEVTTDGGSPVTERGFCWGTLTNPNMEETDYNHVAVNGGVGEFATQLSGLTPNTRYYFRTYAISALGLVYGDVQDFTTEYAKPEGDGEPCPGNATVTDIDGNVYNTVKLGNQCWMKENLRTTRFADGKVIPADIYSSDENTPSRYMPDKNAANVAQYGYLYNLNAATHGAGTTTANPSGVQGVCPEGWHLPSMAEWEQLNNYLGTYPVYMSNHSNPDYVGKALASTTDWQFNSVAYTVGNDLSKNNVAGFSAMPAGYTVFDMYHGFGQTTIFWTATHGTGSGEYSYPVIGYNLHHLSSTNGYEDRGYAVRCVLGAGQNAATVITQSVGQITTTSATCGGNVTADGGAEVTARGVCWSLNSNPTIADNHTTDGTGTGSFTSAITGLTSGHNYYVRAYATNSIGTTYGSEIMFTTPVSGSETPTLSTPVVTTAAVTNLRSESATCGGAVTSDGGATVYARGICWSTTPNPTVADSHVQNGTGTGSFTCQMTGLAVGTTYYVRAYATNSVGTAYGDAQIFSLQVPAGDGQPCPEAATVTDYDGNVYNTVKIGNQCWTKENLRSAHYADGQNIADLLAPQNNVGHVAEYGYLYAWDAVMHGADHSSANPSGVQGICPAGWHVPSDAEWTQLTDYVATQNAYVCGVADGAIAKALAAETHWVSATDVCAVANDPESNNVTGFTALPAGREYGNGFGFGEYAYFWSTTADADQCWTRTIFYNNYSVNRNKYSATSRFSVRCVRGTGANAAMVTTRAANDITSVSATLGGNVVSDGGAAVTERGVCWSTHHAPTVEGSSMAVGTGLGLYSVQVSGLTPSTTYYARAYATNGMATVYGAEVTFSTAEALPTIPEGDGQPCVGNPTVTDFDGNVYNTVRLGNQCWMKENLKSTHSADGTEITGKYAPNGNASRVSAYGYLYTWTAAMNGANSTVSNPSGVQGICPDGWHLPSEAEWSQLTDYLNGLSVYKCMSGSDNIAKALAAETGWNTADGLCVVGNNLTENNTTGFSALPAGYFFNDNYMGYGTNAAFWSATYPTGSYVRNLTLDYNNSHIHQMTASTDVAYSVRCVLGAAQGSTTSVPSSGEPCPGMATMTDYDGNVYNTVKIGEQCWMKENLRTSHFADGAEVSNRLMPAGTPANVATYGYLYNWDEVMNGATATNANPSGVQGICPAGWHVPSAAEWLQLTDYLNSASAYGCDNMVNATARSLASQSEWATSYVGCAVGNDLSQNNLTGFGAMPAGSSSYTDFGYNAYFWSTTSQGGSNAKNFALYYNQESAYQQEMYTGTGMSVRCVRGVGAGVASVTTAAVSNLADVTVTCGGNVTADGGATVTERGICWGTSHNPTTTGSHTASGDGLGEFSLSVSDLTPSTVYYVRAYAVNAMGTSYGAEVSFQTFSYSPYAPANDGQPCVGNPTVTDFDGNVYNTVQIGNQCWMKENLRVKHFPNAVAIPDGSTGEWPARYNPYGDTSLIATYGYLYNWFAVMNGASSSNVSPSNVQGVCPDGWHVPSDVEWQQLIDYVKSQNAYICNSSSKYAKALAANTLWNASTTNCAVGNDLAQNDATGFSALPAGYRQVGGGFANAGNYAAFWTTSRNGSAAPLNRVVAYNNYDVSRMTFDNREGLSVRCVLGAGASLPEVNTGTVSETTTTTAVCGGEVVADGGSAVTVRGICWSTSNMPTIADNRTSEGSGIGTFTSSLTGLSVGSTYYMRAYATNALGTYYGDVVSFTTAMPVGDGMPCPGVSSVQDYDGNYYNTVQIGEQCWLKENMKSLHYADGVAIPDGSLLAASGSNPYYYYPGNDANYAAQYGLLYNWSAALNNLEASSENPSGVQGICPNGWHVPSNAEWQQLTDYVNGITAYQCSGQNGYIAKAMSAVADWNPNSTTCTPGNNIPQNNTVGFAAMPAGYMSQNSSFSNSANFWSTSLAYLNISGGSPEVVLSSTNTREEGLSVRCLKNDLRTKPTIRTVEVNSVKSTTATVVSDLTYSGGDQITGRGVVWSTSPHPILANSRILQQGVMGELNSSLTNLEPNTTYYVRAYAMNRFFVAYGQELEFRTFPNGDLEPCPDAATVSDYDGNVYNTLKLGSQCWMRENLHSTHYADGSSISNYYAGSPVAGTIAQNGYYYTWNTAMRGATSTLANPSGVQGVCPEGWHLPSRTEWQQLSDYLVSHNQYCYGAWNGAIGKGLASTENWADGGTMPNVVGVNPSENNITGFGAMPAGYYNGTEVVDYSRISAFLGATSGIVCRLSYNSPFLDSIPFSSGWAGSVRCVRGAGVDVPQVSSDEYVRTGNASIRCKGTVLSDGGSAVTERGFCWSIQPHPMVTDPYDNPVPDNLSAVSTQIANELSNLPYSGTHQPIYVRAYATNGAGTGYGEEFTVSLWDFVVPNSGVESYTVPNGMTTFPVYDHAGPVSNYDPDCDGTLELKMNNSDRVFKIEVTCNTESGYDKLFIYDGTVSPNNLLAEVSGQNVTQGPVYSSGKQIQLRFVSDHSTSYGGFVVNVTKVPDIPAGDAEPCPGIPTVTDIDNNVYHTVKIGNQCWMRENLRTTRYADGTQITANTAMSASTPYYFNPASGLPGLLYNWAAVMHGAGASTTNPSNVQGICPDGWHVPSVGEWTQLTNYVGNHTVYITYSSGSVSSIAQSLVDSSAWVSSGPYTAGEPNALKNLTGFSILPVGVYDGSFNGLGTAAYFWSTSETPSGQAFANYIYNSSYMFTNAPYDRTHYYAVRCVYGAGDNQLPVVSTGEVVRTHASVARCTGHIDSEGGSEVTEKGFCWSTSPNPTLTDPTTLHISVESMTSDLNGVINNLTGNSYYVRAYATNNAGTAYGHAFHLMKTDLIVPKTGTETYNVPTSKTSFHIYDHGGQYDGYDKNCSGSLVVTAIDSTKALKMTVKTWLIAPQDKLYIYEGNSTTNLIAEMTGDDNHVPVRSAGNTVTLRFVSNDFSQSAGFDVAVELVTPAPAGDALPCPGTPTVTDVDGNVYNTVKIGNQCWMKESLKTKHFPNGNSIAKGSTDSLSYVIPQYYYPNNSQANVDAYGLLYNWVAAVNNPGHIEGVPPMQGICPAGWHLPLDSEWNLMRTYLNNIPDYQCEGQSGAIARSLASTEGWLTVSYYDDVCTPSYYLAAENNNATGFSALPAGGRNSGDLFWFNQMASFWSRTTGSTVFKARAFEINYNESGATLHDNDKCDAYSVRCLKDN